MRYFAFCLIALQPGAAWAITCSMDSVTPLNFGGYDVFAPAPLDTAATLTFTCTGVTALDNVTVDLSQGGALSFGPRELGGPGGRVLAYNLYLDASHVTVWGDGTAGSNAYGPFHPPEATTVPLTVYGRAPAGQSVPAGAYTDDIVATINY